MRINGRRQHLGRGAAAVLLLCIAQAAMADDNTERGKWFANQ
jgi:hypothetical protein